MVDKTVVRYEQAGRLQAVLAALPEATRRHCLQCEAHLLELVLRPRKLQPLPSAPVALPRVLPAVKEAEDEGFSFVDYDDA